MAKLSAAEFAKILSQQGQAEAAKAIPQGVGNPAEVIAGKGGILKSLKKGAKRFGPEIIGWMLLEKYLSSRHESKLRDIQMGAAGDQVNSTTPDDLYYQATLPQAKEEEDMARNALLTHLSGGVIGPTLARGERRIGG